MKRSLAVLAVLTTLACHETHTSLTHVSNDFSNDFSKEEESWRETRRTRLTSESGWLTLVGLDWLNQGENAVKLPAKPEITAHVTLAGNKATLQPDPSLSIDGKPVTAPVELKDDGDENPTLVKAGTLSFLFIKRGDKAGERYALRVKDSASEARTNFKGLDYFPADPKYRVEARFEAYNPPKKVTITNVLGMTSDETTPGALVFTLDGKEYRLEPILEQGESDLFIIFKDATSGKETYGAARYLYAHPAGAGGKTIVDFNKAYNPPCAFTPFATCPLPPPGNRLPVRIEAGEKQYAGHHA
jgi:uncharacterized protein (DUF1684 family)